MGFYRAQKLRIYYQYKRPSIPKKKQRKLGRVERRANELTGVGIKKRVLRKGGRL